MHSFDGTKEYRIDITYFSSASYKYYFPLDLLPTTDDPIIDMLNFHSRFGKYLIIFKEEKL